MAWTETDLLRRSDSVALISATELRRLLSGLGALPVIDDFEGDPVGLLSEFEC